MALVHSNICALLNIAVPVIVKIFVPHYGYGRMAIVVDYFVLPLVLIVWNSWCLFTKIERSVLRCGVLILFGLLLGDSVGYLIWGVSIGHLFHPDDETVWIVEQLGMYHAAVAVIFLVGVSAVKFFARILTAKQK